MIERSLTKRLSNPEGAASVNKKVLRKKIKVDAITPPLVRGQSQQIASLQVDLGQRSVTNLQTKKSQQVLAQSIPDKMKSL